MVVLPHVFKGARAFVVEFACVGQGPPKLAKIRKFTTIGQKRANSNGKINNSHIFQPIGLIFEYVVGPTVLQLQTKFQPPSSFTFWLGIFPVRYTFLFSGPSCLLALLDFSTPKWVFSCPNRPKSRTKCMLQIFTDMEQNRLP